MGNYISTLALKLFLYPIFILVILSTTRTSGVYSNQAIRTQLEWADYAVQAYWGNLSGKRVYTQHQETHVHSRLSLLSPLDLSWPKE